LITFSEPLSVKLGHNDRESEDRLFEDDSWQGHQFGWDCENPEQVVQVGPFKVESLPVTNAEYLEYIQATDAVDGPASWVTDGSQWRVRTLYGSVPMSVARHWPVMASGEELEAYAKWKGGRLPTEAELMALWTCREGPRPAGRDANVGLKRWHPVP
jgi:formylglycine-generating enzyme required for sulfatase activity